MKTMIKRVARMEFFMCMFVACAILCPGMVGAHAPSEVKIAYDQASQTLTVTITHTRPSDSHYVNKVEIKKNGSSLISTEYKNQTGETVTYSYKTAAVAGDTFEVKAYCNKFGTKTQKLTVPGPSKSSRGHAPIAAA